MQVGRALDSTKPAKGQIYLPDPAGDPTLIRGVGTNFESADFQVGGLIVLPSVNNTSANSEIAQIMGPEEIRVKKPFKGKVAIMQLTGREDVNDDGMIPDGNEDSNLGCAEGFKGINFKVAPKVDQTQVYDAVFDKLNRGGCVGIFPEGGSHDRTELLPLKGVFCGNCSSCNTNIAYSGCRHHGSGSTSSQPRLWPEDRSLRDELFPRTQIQIKGRHRVRDPG